MENPSMRLGCKPTSNRRFRLRAANSAAHARLDAVIEEGRFLIDRQRYSSYLRATYRARTAVEQALRAADIEQLDRLWNTREISSEIRTDILDINPTQECVCEVSPFRFISAPAALGGLYVLEGSSLGAQIIMRRIAAIGFNASYGARHLQAQINSLSGWRTFLDMLDSYPMSEREELDCAFGAAAVFDRFGREFQAAILST